MRGVTFTTPIPEFFPTRLHSERPSAFFHNYFNFTKNIVQYSLVIINKKSFFI